MLTPQEIRDVQFDKAVFGGYDMGAVDEFLAELGADYSALYKENAVLKNKLKLLAETVEEYRSVDEAMRKALVTAQNMANDMVADAQKKANDLIANASTIAQTRVTDLANQITAEEKRLKEAKNATASFVNEVMVMYKNQAEMLAGMVPLTEVEEDTKPTVDDTLTMATEQISQSVEEALNNFKSYQNVEEENKEDPAQDMIENIGKQIEEKPMEEVGGKESNADKVQSYSVVDGNDPEIREDDGQIMFADGEQATADNANTKKFDFSDLKFGKNYDFDEEA